MKKTQEDKELEMQFGNLEEESYEQMANDFQILEKSSDYMEIKDYYDIMNRHTVVI